jgi:hypothetical protein
VQNQDVIAIATPFPGIIACGRKMPAASSPILTASRRAMSSTTERKTGLESVWRLRWSVGLPSDQDTGLLSRCVEGQGGLPRFASEQPAARATRAHDLAAVVMLLAPPEAEPGLAAGGQFARQVDSSQN